jgi:hypothetical protein
MLSIDLETLLRNIVVLFTMQPAREKLVILRNEKLGKEPSDVPL